MKGNVALFCIILIVFSSVLEINALFPNGCRKCTTKAPVSESPRQFISPTKLAEVRVGALFCIILIVISSVLEINALGNVYCSKCTTNRRLVSKSPRPNILPTKSYSLCYMTGSGQVPPSIFWIRGAGLRDSRPNL